MSDRITRRDLLKLSVMTAGGVAIGLIPGCGPASPAAAPTTAPLAPTQAPAASTAAPVSKAALKIGILTSLSGVYAQLGEDMVSGLQLYLDKINNAPSGRPVTLVREDDEAKPDVGLTKARKLIEQDKVDFVVGIVSSAVALGVRDLFDSTQTILIISNAGANDVTRKRKSKYIFRTSFSNWQPNFPVGDWAFKNAGKKVFIAAPDYAAGHEQMDAFSESFKKAGGTVAGQVFPPFGTTSDYQPFITQIAQAKPDFCYAFFSGSEALRFVQQYEQFGVKKDIPLYGSGFLTEEDVLPQQKGSALGIKTGLHYTTELDNAENKAFVQAFTKKSNRAPATFAVQTYDAMQLIDLALKATNGETSDKNKVIAAMEGIKFNSPRGAITIDAETHNVIHKMYMREVKDSGGGVFRNVVIQDLGETRDPGA